MTSARPSAGFFRKWIKVLFMNQKNMNQEKNEWVDAGPAADVPEEDILERVLEDRIVALYKLNGQIHATDGLCSHEAVRLCMGLVDGDTIECPKHNARFHIPTGKALRRPAKTDIRVYPVRIDSGRVYLRFR